MKKVAPGFYILNETHAASQGVELEMAIDKIDGEYMDTHVKIGGEGFCIGGQQRHEFVEELGALVDKYRI